jgi:hypothetical protein
VQVGNEVSCASGATSSICGDNISSVHSSLYILLYILRHMILESLFALLEVSL